MESIAICTQRLHLLLVVIVYSHALLATSECLADNEPTRTGTQAEDFKLLLKETPKPDYGVSVPVQVSGRVVLHEQGRSSEAEGVSVTDGYSVVKTDAQGTYTLTPDPSAVFIYITRPSRCDVQGDWYKPLAAKVDFALKPAAGDENDYVFVHVTDTHVSENPRSVAGLRRFVQEVNALTPKPRFVVNSGDLLNLHKALLGTPAAGRASFRNYVGIMNHLTMAHYSVAGDHTDSSYRLDEFPRGDHRCGKALYWEHLGPHFFSFEYGKIHFVSVDFGYHLGQRQIPVNGQNLEYPTNQVQPMHVEWLKQDMANRTPGSFVVTTAESDLTRFCPGFGEIATRHDVRLQLVGDDHIVSYKTKPVPCRTGGALSGCWWNPKARQLCPDLSPQGYLIYRITGETLECFYKGLGQRVAVVSHRMGAPWKGRVTVQAHVVQPQPDETLEYTLNGKDWKAMREIDRPFYRALYEATVDSTLLSDGRLSFSVRSTASGEVCSSVFVIVNGDDSSLFEADASLTFTVSAATNWTTPRAPIGNVDVLFNGKVVGVLQPKARKEYSLRISASHLKEANTLAFRFLEPGDGMSLSSPVLAFQGKTYRDPRDEALRRVKTGHWGDKAADWGGFIAGDAQPPDESPFHRRQNVFCFVLSGVE